MGVARRGSIGRGSGEGGSVLEVAGLRKSYGPTVALAGIDLAVAAGEIVGLLGPNGAGKTTLVSIVAGLLRPDAGSVVVGGIDALAHPRRASRHLGLAPQETGIYPTLTCAKNLRFFGELAGLRGRELDREVDSIAEALQLTALFDRRGQQLSGGERRRLHTALALVHRPRLVLLDEPTTGADVQSRSQLLQFVQELAAAGSAVVYSTHYLHEVEQLDASVVIIDHGRCIARGSAAELVASHAANVVQLVFDGPAPHIDPKSNGARVNIEGSVVHIHTHDPGAVTAAVLEGLGSRARDLRSLEVIQPSLEAVFLELTGRRYQPDSHDETSNVA
jgi:ABC-2 type transport system ATP-binding protein